MMTQTHLLVASALLARPGEKLRNVAVIAGALLPDLAIYTLFIWSKLAGVEERLVWREIYWRDDWQMAVAAGNSIPIFAVLLLAGLVLLRNSRATFRIGLFATFLALAALTHLAGDLPFHNGDAHRHFWPLTDWKFHSPISYWDPDHHGRVFSYIEAALGVVLAVILFRRFSNRLVRVLLVLLCAAYVAVPLYFTFMLSGG